MFKELMLLAFLAVTRIAAEPQSGPFAKDECAQSGLPLPNPPVGGPRCSRTTFGAIPSIGKMVSTLITTPSDGAVFRRSKKEPLVFTISTSNLEFGHADDIKTEYRKTGQILNSKGMIKGHTHLVIQKLVVPSGATGPNRPPSPGSNDLAFFQPLDSEALPPRFQTHRTLTFSIGTESFPVDGLYRACTMTSSAAHVPVIMPVEVRGTQDDCIRFNIAL
ncbi:hypothetical protein BKA69DRAFT_1126514 [Paraphysoderma sedebokerense]|nr:hypothetical protein BKA69DRAFT_1126514 [Paraphysoderma sedebokerense]